ncbi:adenylate/guanylate cyclase domain-containing protein [Bradyrhizobium jicamae]|uniref:adenylate/guanylate cyclase domain-containing protein n=1 Tax=Bradyrhizobium jicamae TaxID=280332 RepID=UPI001BAD2D14|nr:adenylate/guanylate cyclase domain-containing protein [Bradyrhizobium jicamae]MBR0934455.1 AAA family ATPase [Bradyrhizobium jicamae]
MDLGGWLRSLGLERYEAAFRENEIDDAVLPSLTPEDLKELGVHIVGHRRKLLDAIAGLRAASGPGPRTAGDRSSGILGSGDAERRQVTVMFSDLVGSTALSTQMDAEDLREIISAYQKSVAATVRRFDGLVAKYMGDGVLIYFGYPAAHEDDAERAVHAALELIAAVAELDVTIPLQVRVGISTGLVVVGDLIGSGEAQERGIVGATPNLAARLQSVAAPNTIVVAEATRRLLRNVFELDDLGPQKLKGVTEPMRAWAVLGPRSIEGRFDAEHGSSFTPLVARERELELLLRGWQSAVNGHGCVVQLAGEPGIGKSRVVAALEEHTGTQAHQRLRYFCSPLHSDSALFPIIRQIERAAGFVHGDSTAEKLDKLDAALRDSVESTEDRALVADLMSLPNDGRYPHTSLDAQDKRRRTLSILLESLEAIARRKPVLIIFEDLHWIDPTSLELANKIAMAVRSLPVLMVTTFRPEFYSALPDQPHVSSIVIHRLDEQAAAEIARLVGGQDLPADVLSAIAQRSDGVPLFIEEITKAAVEIGGEASAGTRGGTGTSSAGDVPASLHASLMARLDRQGSAREIAQIGAGIGREFSHRLLAAVASWDESELREAIDRLVAAGLVFREGNPPHATYQFKHALLRDAAYGTLLRDARRQLHGKIARSIELLSPDTVETRPELLAHHYTEAGILGTAVTLWGRAGHRSHARSALEEAEQQLGRAISLTRRLPGTPALRRDQIELQVELATVLMHTKGYGADETREAAAQARVLIENAQVIGEAPADPMMLFSVIYGFWVVNIAGFNGDAARELAAEFVGLAERQGRTGPLLLGHRMMGVTLMSVGDPVQGRAHLDRALDLFDPAEHRDLAARFGTDAQVAILEWRSRTLWLLGYPEAAHEDVERSFRVAREIGHAATLMHALAHSTITLILCGSYAEAASRARELIVLAGEKGSSYWKANGQLWEGCLAALTGGSTQAVEILAPTLQAYRLTGATIYAPYVMGHLARAYADLGDHEAARRTIDQARVDVERTKERWCEPELHRIAGELALVSLDGDELAAERHFERALEVARGQRARGWELRASISLSRLWRRQGKLVEARGLLASVNDGFPPSLDTPDLSEARRILDELYRHLR